LIPMKKPSGISHVARGIAGKVVEFAERQTFSPAEKILSAPDGAPRRSLQRVLCELLDSEINAGVQTFAFDSFRVWIGDEVNGIEATGEITPGNPAWSDDGAIAHWLHDTAIRRYPQSEYAKRCQSFDLLLCYGSRHDDEPHGRPHCPP